MNCSLVSSCWDEDVENWIELFWFSWFEYNEAITEPDSPQSDWEVFFYLCEWFTPTAGCRLRHSSDSGPPLAFIRHRRPERSGGLFRCNARPADTTLACGRRWWQAELWPVTTGADASNPEKIQEHFYTTASQAPERVKLSPKCNALHLTSYNHMKKWVLGQCYSLCRVMHHLLE